MAVDNNLMIYHKVVWLWTCSNTGTLLQLSNGLLYQVLVTCWLFSTCY